MLLNTIVTLNCTKVGAIIVTLNSNLNDMIHLILIIKIVTLNWYCCVASLSSVAPLATTRVPCLLSSNGSDSAEDEDAEEM